MCSWESISLRATVFLTRYRILALNMSLVSARKTHIKRSPSKGQQIASGKLTHAHTHTRTCSRKKGLSCYEVDPCQERHTKASSDGFSLAHSRTHSHTDTRSRPNELLHTHIHAHVNTCTRAYTHKRIHSRSLIRMDPLLRSQPFQEKNIRSIFG